MRVYFAQIIKSYDDPEYKEGLTICYKGHNSPHASRGVEMDMRLVNIETEMERTPCRTLGLGYADFGDEDDYRNRSGEIIKRKLKELGHEQH